MAAIKVPKIVTDLLKFEENMLKQHPERRAVIVKCGDKNYLGQTWRPFVADYHEIAALYRIPHPFKDVLIRQISASGGKRRVLTVDEHVKLDEKALRFIVRVEDSRLLPTTHEQGNYVLEKQLPEYARNGGTLEYEVVSLKKDCSINVFKTYLNKG